MKRFQFSLDRVLNFRRLQADAEQAKLIRLEQELAAVDAEIRSLRDAFRAAIQTVSTHPADRAELGRYRMIVESQTLKLQSRRREIENRVQLQRQLFTKALQAAEVLARLKEKQYTQWQKGLQKELDNLAMDSFLARWKQ
jgi:flagellar FliJ protein